MEIMIKSSKLCEMVIFFLHLLQLLNNYRWSTLIILQASYTPAELDQSHQAMLIYVEHWNKNMTAFHFSFFGHLKRFHPGLRLAGCSSLNKPLGYKCESVFTDRPVKMCAVKSSFGLTRAAWH